MKNIFTYLIILLSGLYGVKLYLFNQLIYYVNQNSIWYILTGSIACTIIAVIGLIICFPKQISFSFNNINSPKSFIFKIISILPLFFLLTVGYLLPPRPYVSTSFTGFFNPIIPQVIGQGYSNNIIGQILGYDTNKYMFEQWFNAEELSKNNMYFNGRPVELTGQIYQEGHSSFYLGRLYIWCCTVDARPFGFKVIYPLIKGSQIPFNNGDWVQIQGAFELSGKSNTPIILPLSIRPVHQPENPYVN